MGFPRISINGLTLRQVLRITVAILRLSILQRRFMRLFEDGRYGAAFEVAERACEIARRKLGEIHTEHAESLLLRASARAELRQLDEAEQDVHRALEMYRSLYGPAHLEVSKTLHYLARLRKERQDYAGAEDLCKKALSLLTAGPTPDLHNLALIRHTLAVISLETGSFAAGEAACREALDMARTVLGEDHPDLLMLTRTLSAASFVLGHKEKAESLCRWCIESQTRRGLQGSRQLAIDLYNLANILEASPKRQREVKDLRRQVLETLGKTSGTAHPTFGMALLALANTQMAAGELNEAEDSWERGHAILQAALPDHDPRLANSWILRARLLEYRSLWREAEQAYLEFLESCRMFQNDLAFSEQARALLALGKISVWRADLAEAEKRLRAAVKILFRKVGPTHLLYGNALIELSRFYELTGSRQTAELLVEEAVEILRKTLGPQSLPLACALDQLASLSLPRSLDAAWRLHEEARTIYQTTEEWHPWLTSHLEQQAKLLFYKGDDGRAEGLFREILRIQRREVGPRSPEVAITLSNLCLLYIRRGQYRRVERFLRFSMKILRAELGPKSPYLAMVLRNMALVVAAAGRLVEARAFADEALRMDDQLMRRVFQVGNENQRISALQIVRDTVALLLSLLRQDGSCSNEDVKSVFERVLWHKALGAEAVAVRREALLTGRYPELEPRLRELSQLRAQLSARIVAGLAAPAGEEPESYRKTLLDGERRIRELEVELSLQIPEMAMEASLRHAGCDTVAAALSSDSALVEIVKLFEIDVPKSASMARACYLPTRYLAFVVPGRNPEGIRLIDLGPSEPIDRKIAELTARMSGRARGRHLALTSPQPEAGPGPDIAREIRSLVVDPLLPALGDRRQLIIAPDGELARLSFDILPTEEGRFLIDHFRIRYLPSGRDLLRQRPEGAPPPSPPLVLADPDFDLEATAATPEPTPDDEEPPLPEPLYRDGKDPSRHLFFQRLPGAHAEGEMLGHLLGVEPWLGATVLEGRLKREARSPFILHLATHGFFLEIPEAPPESPVWSTPAGASDLRWMSDVSHLCSGLALAGINTAQSGRPTSTEAEDGWLTPDDVACLELTATELVVLSACETGMGRIHIGEGVLGLRRAFLSAGARTLVLSLWRVPDDKTLELMEAFYRRLLHGEDRVEALRAARLGLRETCPDPAIWGAFFCEGADGPLEIRSCATLDLPRARP